MPRLLAGSLLLLVVLLSGVALLFLLPWLKEGHDFEDLPTFAGVVVTLALVGLVFVRFTRRAPGLRAVGVATLLLPVLAYLAVIARLLWNEAEGRRLARTVRVVRLVEQEIRWPGFDGPVGLRLQIELEHRLEHEGTLFAPKLLLGGPRPLERSAYFYGVFNDWERGYLAVPLFDGERPDAAPIPPGTSALLDYDLFPGLVRRARPQRVCLSEVALRLKRGLIVYADGPDLSASWIYVVRGGAQVDLGPLLSAVLRRESRFQGRREEWQALLRRLEPAGLEKAGFVPCTEEPSPAGEACYCRAVRDAQP